MSSPLPASLSELRSRGVAAVQSGRVVVAISCLRPGPVHGWRVTLAAGPVGACCQPVASTTVAGRTRAQAIRAALSLAERYAHLLKSGQFPLSLKETASNN